MSMVRLALPVVSPAVLVAANRPALLVPLAAEVGRFAPPPWDLNSPEWQRLDRNLSSDHLARRIDRAVGLLDLSALLGSYRGRGSLPCRPDLLLKVVLLEAQRGRHSPAEWLEDLHETEPCQWLAFGMRPSRSRLYAFRDRLADYLDDWQQQLMGLAMSRGLTTASEGSLDGTLIAANATRHRTLNEDLVNKRLQWLAQALTADQADQPMAQQPAWMASTPQGRQRQQQRYQQVQEQLQVRLQDNRQRSSDKRLEAKHVRVSPGDPEAALGRDKEKVFRPLYNVQLVPDLNSPLVLAYEVFTQTTDAGTLPQLLQRCQEATGRVPDTLLADATYASALDLAACAAQGVTLMAPYQENDFSTDKPKKQRAQQLPKEAFTWLEEEQQYLCPEGHAMPRVSTAQQRRATGLLSVSTYRCPSQHCQACPRQPQCAKNPRLGRSVNRHEHEHLVEALKQRMNSDDAKRLYRRRAQTVELRFADAKEHRKLRKFSGRGRRRVKVEVGLAVIAHNALTILKDELHLQHNQQQNATPEESSG